ncbi:MAG: ABC transporter permease [Haloarculaceae archaeon]
MRGTNTAAIYVLWLREMKRFSRSKSRIVSTLALPFLFLVGFWFGFRSIQLPGVGGGVNYLQYLVPGIVGMTMLFTASFGGISVLFDRQFGFLKEILVTPVDRVSIALGRVAGSTTSAVVQGLLLLAVAVVIGFRPVSWLGVPLAVGFMVLIGATFIGVGLVFASRIDDFQAFNLIVNFVLFPLLFLSGAIYPVTNFPTALQYATYLNPLTYGIDGLRGVLVGVSMFPPLLDAVVVTGFALAFVVAGAYAFEGSDAV